MNITNYLIKLFPIEKNHPPENEIVGLYNEKDNSTEIGSCVWSENTGWTWIVINKNLKINSEINIEYKTDDYYKFSHWYEL